MVDFHTSRPGHDLRYALDGGLMKELGWEPKISIDERINQVVRWTLENERWLKIREHSLYLSACQFNIEEFKIGYAIKLIEQLQHHPTYHKYKKVII